ncbi:MAG: DUF167 domain-containing protein [Candidatus Lokiarchaeota archaeon]|nr:DUF167 domain-containing protein [Candidatus Harpocratesius repetitus]
MKKKKLNNNNKKITTDAKNIEKYYEFIKFHSNNESKSASNHVILEVHVKPNARQDQIILSNSELQITVKTPPLKGKANKAVIDILSKSFNIPKRNIILRHGQSSTTKIFEFDNISTKDFITRCSMLESVSK